jgi:hypothetical protein
MRATVANDNLAFTPLATEGQRQGVMKNVYVVILQHPLL